MADRLIWHEGRMTEEWWEWTTAAPPTFKANLVYVVAQGIYRLHIGTEFVVREGWIYNIHGEYNTPDEAALVAQQIYEDHRAQCYGLDDKRVAIGNALNAPVRSKSDAVPG